VFPKETEAILFVSEDRKEKKVKKRRKSQQKRTEILSKEFPFSHSSLPFSSEKEEDPQFGSKTQTPTKIQETTTPVIPFVSTR
jgi:ribosome assembly protein YihI (activator of Der GTPase)